MLISLFPTPFDHFHFHGSAGLVPKLILTPCLTRFKKVCRNRYQIFLTKKSTGIATGKIRYQK